MARHPPERVKYFVALLWSDAALLPEVIAALGRRWGPIDCQGSDHPFDATSYYEEEMGGGLMRRLISFEPLGSPEQIAEAKIACNDLEAAWSTAGRRRVNLDIGYLDHNKIVLASVKPAGQKIYLKDGVYADLVARYTEGRYQPFPWTFPDFKTGRYDADLARIRETYLRQRQQWTVDSGQ